MNCFSRYYWRSHRDTTWQARNILELLSIVIVQYSNHHNFMFYFTYEYGICHRLCTVFGSKPWHVVGTRLVDGRVLLLLFCSLGWGGAGWGGVITFICTSSHIWCYAIVWGGVGWGEAITFICISSHMWCYVIVWGGAGWGNNVHLRFLTDMMLRYCMSSCTSSHTWCYATVSRLALSHRYDVTLLYVVLHFLTYMMLRYCKSSCTFSHIWCYAALPQHVNATSKVAGHTLMSEDVKAMVNQWVFRQSLGPITPIAFLEELKRLFKQWGKKGYEVLLRSSLEQGKNQERQKTLSFFLKIPFRATAVYQAWT